MQFRSTRSLAALAVAAIMLAGLAPASRAQDHVVATQELHKAAGQAAEARASNEASIRRLLSSERAQETLKSAHVEYQQVDKAVGQLSDEDVAKMAARSREVENDFAAGRFSDRDLLIIVLVALGIILIALVAR